MQTDLILLTQTVSENARLEVNRSNCSGGGDGGGNNSYNSAPDDDLELWDQSGYMLRNDTDDSLANGKLVPICLRVTADRRTSLFSLFLLFLYVASADGEVRKGGVGPAAFQSRSS